MDNLQDKELEQQQEQQQADEQQQEEKKFSQEEVDGIIKSRLEREMKKFKQELSEAEKLAKLSEEEKAKLEIEKIQKELESEKAQFQKEKLEMEATKILSKEGLPVDFAPVLLGADAEQTKANIDTFKASFQDAVQKAVDEKIKGGYTPKTGASDVPAITVEQFKTMDFEARTQLFNENPELYKKLRDKAQA
ncbi:DUF4355 domain-containing protein [Exiguobacterium aurantiacum]|uniref:DUF4355 domain-containing protein n=1 Tax=Exiguobacterium aurantiacum TaxID=33987 RepID=UPI00384FE176